MSVTSSAIVSRYCLLLTLPFDHIVQQYTSSLLHRLDHNLIFRCHRSRSMSERIVIKDSRDDLIVYRKASAEQRTQTIQGSRNIDDIPNWSQICLCLKRHRYTYVS